MSNLGNGTYIVYYNLTISGRYDVHITLKWTEDNPCDFPAPVSAGKLGLLNGGERRCHLATQRTEEIERLKGVEWCPFGSNASLCTTYTFGHQDGLSPRPPMSPFSVFIDSGPTEINSVQAFGTGLSFAVSGLPAFFMLRIKVSNGVPKYWPPHYF